MRSKVDIYSAPHPRRHEIAVLLACSRTQMDSAVAERLRFLLMQKLDWDYLLWLASWHRVTRLLMLQLKQLPANLVPETVLEQLRRQSATLEAWPETRLFKKLRCRKNYRTSYHPLLASCFCDNGTVKS